MGFAPNVILVGKIIMLPNLHLLKTRRCTFGGQNNHAAKITSTCFTWKMSRCNFGGQNKKWRELFPVHEIRRIHGRKVFQNGGTCFKLTGTCFTIKKTKFRSKFWREKGPESQYNNSRILQNSEWISQPSVPMDLLVLN
jgi:hypothetical protein